MYRSYNAIIKKKKSKQKAIMTGNIMHGHWQTFNQIGK